MHRARQRIRGWRRWCGLTERFALDAARFHHAGHGEDRLTDGIDPNSPRHRRVEIVVFAPESRQAQQEDGHEENEDDGRGGEPGGAGLQAIDRDAPATLPPGVAGVRGRRALRLGSPGQAEGELRVTVRDRDETVQVSLRLRSNQGGTTAAVTARLDKKDFPPGMVGDGPMYGFIIRKGEGRTSAKELDGAKVCVQTGTTKESNLAAYFHRNGMRYMSIPHRTESIAMRKLGAGECDAYIEDIFKLEVMMRTYPDGYYTILPERIYAVSP